MIPAHKHLVQWGLDQGFTIEVNCEGETDYYGTDYDEAIEAIEATEHGAILLVDSSTKNEPINYHASFYYAFDYDQQPDEIIYDYGINKISEKWASDFFEFFLNCEVKYIYKPSNN